MSFNSSHIFSTWRFHLSQSHISTSSVGLPKISQLSFLKTLRPHGVQEHWNCERWQSSLWKGHRQSLRISLTQKLKPCRQLIWVVNKRNQRYIVGVANQIYVIDRVKIAVKFNRFMNSFIVQHLTKLRSEQRFVDMNRNFDRLSKKSLTTALIFCWHDVNWGIIDASLLHDSSDYIQSLRP